MWNAGVKKPLATIPDSAVRRNLLGEFSIRRLRVARAPKCREEQ